MKTFEEVFAVVQAVRRIDLYDDIIVRAETNENGEQEVSVSINCSDVFWWGTADSEDVEMEDIPLIEGAWQDIAAAVGNPNPRASLVQMLFICRKRKMRPQGAVYTYVPDAVRPLLNMCGPYREVGPGNPYDIPQEVSL